MAARKNGWTEGTVQELLGLTDEEMAAVEEKVSQMTRKSSEGTEVPVIPPRKVPRKVPASSNPVVAICGACNREVRQVEHYSCPRADCPIQPKATL